MTIARSGILAIACLLATAAAPAETIPPHELLARMNEAVRVLDYEGRFVVQSGDRLDAMYIVHRVNNGSEHERVVSLSGNEREIIRSDEAVACLVPGSEAHINVGRRANGRSYSPLRGVSGDQLNRSYQIQTLEPGRVAGRSAHQLLIQPRDDLRYGYRLFVDKVSALPLRSVMFDEAGSVISQMMFVELRINQAITPIEHDVSALQLASAGPLKPVPHGRLTPPAWAFTDLPPGFQLNVHRRRTVDNQLDQLEHFIFSDGLATVSVYVQRGTGEDVMPGVSRLGTARAVGRALDGHEVFVVGEVPEKTLRWFANGIQAAAP